MNASAGTDDADAMLKCSSLLKIYILLYRNPAFPPVLPRMPTRKEIRVVSPHWETLQVSYFSFSMQTPLGKQNDVLGK